ncbi:Uncharacterized protein BM_BM12054 [Brugia malayi]|uniref:TOG domain-containing protein n=3 Tax=Brugia malayi TaxID=6279 RepID=A0A4E9FKC5_BRUMA|nr:Uncharacterized protein BM_BM12054 [Brugia malayi]VIO97471.1 Uncharacterized protein BM_BM12054 [Brugia malayi]
MLAPIATDHSTPLLPPDEDIIEFLRSTDFDVRLQTLSRLTVWLKHDPQWFSKFVKKGDLFKQLERLLMDDRWEVQHQCIKFLHDALPTFGDYMEWCITYLLPSIVIKLGSPKITIRRITNQMLIAYLKLQPDALNIVQKVIGNFLLNNENDMQIKDEALREIPNLMIIECANQNWKFLISSLVEMLHTISSERSEKIIRLLAHFKVYLGTEKLRKILSELSTKQYEIWKKYEQIIFETSDTMKEGVVNKEKMSSSVDVELRYRFGIIPMSTSNMLNNETDATSRIAALEQVNAIMNGITPEDTRKFAAHLHSYFLTLGNVLDDLNFKIVALCLDVIRLTLEKVGALLAPYIQQIVGLISKHFGSQKSAIRQHIMAICMITMRNCSPKSVISYLCVYSEHRNSRIREEILNIMTAALLTFDSRSINLKAIADVVVPLLADPKRRVRYDTLAPALAAFELFAVFAHLSSNSTKRLLKLVSNLEEKHHAYGLLSAVKERISRNTLPKIRSDGLIEYATPLDAPDISACNREGWRWLKTNNLDYEWIMGGANGSSSVLSSELLEESKNEDLFRNDTKASMTERPYSDDCDRYKLNGNGMHEKYLDDHPPLHSVEPIRLQKLHLNGDLHQIAQNDSSTGGNVARCATAISDRSVTGKEPSEDEENLIGNGFDKMKQYNSDGNFLPNNISRSRKITNPGDLPIKSSKCETYCNSYAPSEPAIPTRSSFLSLVRKSFSHQNLACTSKTTGISQRIQASPKVIRKNNLKSASSMRSITSNSSSVISTSKREKCVQNIEMLLKNPEFSLNDALQKLDAEEWNEKLYAIEVIDTLTKISPGVLAANIHPVVMKLLNECKNLRSTVSRAAISSFGALFENLKTVMDSDIEKVCPVLMQKAGDVSNAFIRDDATIALEKMIKYVSPGRSLYALVSSGAKSKSNTIRACCASLLVKLVERLGPINAIGSAEFPRFVTSLLLFARDANVTVRQTGKYGIRLLSQNNDLFDDAVRKSLNESERQNLNEVLDAINRRGLEETNLASSSLSLGSISRSGSTRRSGSNGRDAPISQSIQQDLLQVRNNLIASEWERRMKGLKEFSEIVMRNDRAAISDTKVLGAFVGRTSDINFKVSVEAMETLVTILPTLSPYFSSEASLKAVLYQLINSLMSHLASRSEGHRQHAKLCFEEITKYIENMALLAPFASATKQANVKQKPFMLQTLSKLIESVYSIKPRQAEAVGLPVLWELLRTPPRSCSDPEVREAIRHYAITMARCIGIKTLLQLSTFRINPNQKKTLQELIS